VAVLAPIHGYITGFWVAAAIFGAGALVCGTLFRAGPLRPAGSADKMGEWTASDPLGESSLSKA